MTDKIEINAGTREVLINLNRTIAEAQARIQAVGSAYLDALGEKPDGWQIDQNFAVFVKITDKKGAPKPEPT